MFKKTRSQGVPMNGLSRRNFIKIGSGSAALGLSSPFARLAWAKGKDEPSNRTVHFLSDGLMLTPLEYSQLLVRISKEHGIKPDGYLSGGSVEELEKSFNKSRASSITRKPPLSSLRRRGTRGRSAFSRPRGRCPLLGIRISGRHSSSPVSGNWTRFARRSW
jgi:hypothetical protein